MNPLSAILMLLPGLIDLVEHIIQLVKDSQAHTDEDKRAVLEDLEQRLQRVQQKVAEAKP